MSGLYAVGVRVMAESRSVMGIITDFCWTNSDGGSWVYDVLTDGGQTLPRVFERYLRLPDGTRPVAHTDVDGEALRILVERAVRAERERDEARAALAGALQAAAACVQRRIDTVPPKPFGGGRPCSCSQGDSSMTYAHKEIPTDCPRCEGTGCLSVCGGCDFPWDECQCLQTRGQDPAIVAILEDVIADILELAAPLQAVEAPKAAT